MPAAIHRRQAALTIGFAVVGVGWVASQSGSNSSRFVVPELEIAAAKALLDAGALAIDVRGVEQFGYRHLPGAILVPLVALRVAIPVALAQAKAQQIVVYCNDGHTSGPEATDILRRNGYANAANLRAGVEGWASAGLPFKAGKA